MNRSYLQSICLSRNVPASFLATTIKLDNYLTSCSYKNENGKIIHTTIKEQQQNWQSLLRDSLHSQLVVIHTKHDEKIVQQIGAKIFRRMVIVYYQQPQEKRRKTLPYWYPLPGGSFRDFSLAEKIGNTCGIFLANIHINSTAEKMDKLRDFLQIYKNVARIVMVAGGEPWEFIREKLYTVPDKLLYLGENVINTAFSMWMADNYPHITLENIQLENLVNCNKLWREQYHPITCAVNFILAGDGFWISYNPDLGATIFGEIFDSDTGGPETCLCNGEDYFILNGDYRSVYEKLVPLGYKTCKEFYDQQSSHIKSSWTTQIEKET